MATVGWPVEDVVVLWRTPVVCFVDGQPFVANAVDLTSLDEAYGNDPSEPWAFRLWHPDAIATDGTCGRDDADEAVRRHIERRLDGEQASPTGGDSQEHQTANERTVS